MKPEQALARRLKLLGVTGSSELVGIETLGAFTYLEKDVECHRLFGAGGD